MPNPPIDPNAETLPPQIGQPVDVLATLAPAAATPGAPPAAVAGFEITSEIGRGGMGVVYRARQSGLNRDVALKMVLSGGHASSAERARFLAEAEAIAAVQHPGIVHVYDFGTSDGQPYFALEYCPGGSLANKWNGAPLAPREAAETIATLARAVQAAHEKNIIHRDLKPTNVLLTETGDLRITDFGLARKIDSGSGLTQSGAILGTPSYMSPEQAAGRLQEIGTATDIYALGAMLYEALTGRPPFRAATPLDTVLQVQLEEPVPPSRLAPKLPRDLETICLKCLQKQPAKRYASAAELADDLERFLRDEPIRARPVPAWERVWKAARRRPTATASIIAIMLAVVTIVAVVVVKNSQLARERDVAHQAKETAEKQRALAQSRLEKAVDAVERIMTRVAGEKWATRPELLAERREILEDAVAWFQGFGEEDSKDPIVRRQAGRAYLQCAAVYIALAEYDRARTMADRAAAVFRSLGDEFPEDPAPLRGLAEATTMRGHLELFAANYSEAIGRYQDAAHIAESAVRIGPKDSASQVALADAYLSMAMFLANSDPAKADDYNRRVLTIANDLLAHPTAGFRARQLMFTALVNSGVNAITHGKPDAGYSSFESAYAMLPRFNGLQPPNAHAAQMFVMSRSELEVQYGAQLTLRKKNDDGLKLVREGLAGVEHLLAAQPKSFPLRIRKIQLELIAADALVHSGKSQEAQAMLADMEQGRVRLLADMPQMTWLNDFGFLQRSTLLVEQAREGRAAEVESGVDGMLKKGGSRTQLSIHYNAACAFAQLSRSGPTGDRERFALRAIELLDGLLATSYFRNPQTNNHLDDDSDLDPLRQRSDFREFLAKAKAQRSKK